MDRADFIYSWFTKFQIFRHMKPLVLYVRLKLDKGTL